MSVGDRWDRRLAPLEAASGVHAATRTREAGADWSARLDEAGRDRLERLLRRPLTHHHGLGERITVADGFERLGADVTLRCMTDEDLKELEELAEVVDRDIRRMVDRLGVDAARDALGDDAGVLDQLLAEERP